MRIGIDARMMFMSGIGTYLRNLLAALGRLDADTEYVVILKKGESRRFGEPGRNFRLIESRAEPYSLREQTELALLLARQRLDLVHHPHYFAPAFGRTPMVVTIHDLIHQLFPKLCPSPLHWRASWWMARRSVRRARLILAVSEHTRRDVLKHLRIPAEKVRLTYNALPPGWGESGPEPRAAGAGGDLPYFLYVGNHKRHKNIPLLLDAFKGLLDQGKRARLLLTGERGDLEREMAHFGFGDEVRFLGEISHSGLEEVFRSARALVFPSMYEGFGYPPLEAMGCGTPPIVSDAAALPEVVADGGIVVPVGELAPLRDAMVRILEDDALHERLSARARERARFFSWRRLGEETLRAYRDALPAQAAGAGAAAP